MSQKKRRATVRHAHAAAATNWIVDEQPQKNAKHEPITLSETETPAHGILRASRAAAFRRVALALGRDAGDGERRSGRKGRERYAGNMPPARERRQASSAWRASLRHEEAWWVCLCRTGRWHARLPLHDTTSFFGSLYPPKKNLVKRKD